MKQFVVPDTIEPHLGIKALTIRDGTLHSPQQGTAWPKQKRLEAACKYRSIAWELRDSPEGWPKELFWVPSSVLRQGESTDVGWPTEPAPPGKTWVPHEVEHQLSLCTAKCGIYVVDTPRQCEPYLRDHWGQRNGHTILASVALWGQVVKGNKGARGQYAYPIRLVGPLEWEPQMRATAEAYAIDHTAVPVQETSDAEFLQALRSSA